MNRRNIWIGIIFFFALLSIHLFIINDYSINWDFHHVFFAGLYHIKHNVPPTLWHYLPFTDPDPRRMVETPFGPLQSVVPAISYTTFFEKLKLLPWDSAWNLPAVVMGVAGIFILFIFLLQATNPTTAFIGMALLTLYPRYFGDLHTNVKDITTASAYTLSVYFAWKAVNRRRIIDVILAGLICGFTFNFKVNAIFIPVIIALWSLWLLITPAKKYLTNPIKSWKQNVISPIGIYFIISALSAFGIWSLFWADPYNHLAYLIRFFQFNTINMEVLLGGNWYCSGVNIPWYYPFWYLGIVTPIPILLFFLIGLMSQIRQIHKNPTASLFLLWFFIPLVRFFLPSSSVIDGIRHFEEVVFPLCAIAAVGANTLITRVAYLIGTLRLSQRVTRAEGLPRRGPLVGFLGRKPVAGPAAVTALISIILIWLIYPIITYHPYQLSYFNELVGGIRGAYGKYDMDYWGISQKQAVDWINHNALPNSVVSIVMSADTAAKYLRPDLLKKVNTTDWDHADYVILLNRQSFFYRYFYIHEYMLYHKPTYVITTQGVPLTWIYNNHDPITPRQTKWWQGEDPCMNKYWQ
jgi:hypothetical protein